MKRLLLVEFVVTDRFHCGISLPYIRGAAVAAGIVVRSIRFGVRAATAFEPGSDSVQLSAADRERLARVVDSFEPDRVLFSHLPGAAVIETLGAAVAGSLSEDGRRVVRPDRPGLPLSLAEWYGDGHAGAGMLPERPDFACEYQNGEAAAFRPLPHLLAGAECRYRKPVAANPVFAGLELPACARATGCAFCRRGEETGDGPGDPFDLLGRQLRQAAATLAWGGHRPRYRVIGEQIFLRPERLAEVVADAGIGSADLLFNVRADHIVTTARRLAGALPTLARLDIRLQICLVGIENFSQAELDRFNKGLDTLTLLRAIDALRRLEAGFPATFDYREYGGFSTILYTPWTTLDDIEFNLKMVLHLGIARLCGKLLGSRLRLYPELPLTALAARDGLLADRYDDPLLDTARRNFYPEELPWRFRHPAPGLFNALAARLDPEDGIPADDLTVAVQAWRSQLWGGSGSALIAAIVLLDLVRRRPGASPAEILALEAPA